jgi:hypothetical protein
MGMNKRSNGIGYMSSGAAEKVSKVPGEIAWRKRITIFESGCPATEFTRLRLAADVGEPHFTTSSEKKMSTTCTGER